MSSPHGQKMCGHSVEGGGEDNLVVEGITFKSLETDPSLPTVDLLFPTLFYGVQAVDSGSYLEPFFHKIVSHDHWTSPLTIGPMGS